MKQLLAVLNSDAVNRYRMKFTIAALEGGLSQSWLEGVPTHISHDIHRPIGWTRPLGLYLEPGLARLVGIILIPEAMKEQEILYKTHQRYIDNFHTRQCTPYVNGLKDLLNGHLQGDERCVYVECVALWDDGLAERAFSKVFEQKDKDGLIPLKFILKHFEQIGPGVFKHKKHDLAVFTHPYFRKSLSRLNNYNTSFLSHILDLSKRKNLEVKLSLDPDLVGLASTYKKSIELEYWWGPKFNENIEKIPPGVTVHASSEYQKIFHGISKTEFWWKVENSIRTFEAEELKEIPSLGIGEDKFGCRYIHAMFDISQKAFRHFDGAIRIYSKDEMKERLNKDIKKAGRHTHYIKLFRIDGGLDISEWKSFVSDYFQGNPLPIEYFGGDRESNLEPTLVEQQNTGDIKYTFCPYSIEKGMGIRLFISYHPIDKKSLGIKREVIVLDTITVNNTKYKVIEYDIIEFEKALQTLGDDLQLPYDVKLLACEDLYVNIPVIKHSRKYLPTNLQNTIKAIDLIVNNLSKRNKNHVISFTLAWPTENKEVRLSTLGHVEDVHKWISHFPDSIPFSDDKIGSWLEKAGEWLTKNYPKSNDVPPLAKVVQPTGVLWIQRSLLSPEIKFRPYYSDEHRALMLELAIPRTEKQLAGAIQKKLLQVAPAFFVNESECSKCKKEYKICPHSKYLNADVYQVMKNVELTFAFWTDKKA